MRPAHHNDPGNGSYEILKLNLERIAGALEGEYAENDRRLNWFLLFQAFLFQGYATALQAITGASGTVSLEVAHARALLAILIVIGVLTCTLTIMATRAGIRAIEWLKSKRENVCEIEAAGLGIENVGFPVSGRLHHLGLLPTKWAPLAILAAWAGLTIHAVHVDLFRI